MEYLSQRPMSRCTREKEINKYLWLCSSTQNILDRIIKDFSTTHNIPDDYGSHVRWALKGIPTKPLTDYLKRSIAAKMEKEWTTRRSKLTKLMDDKTCKLLLKLTDIGCKKI